MPAMQPASIKSFIEMKKMGMCEKERPTFKGRRYGYISNYSNLMLKVGEFR